MKLYIDTSDREKITIGIDKQSLAGSASEKRVEVKSKKGSSQMLLTSIDKMLAQNKKNINDISEIIVATGPGSFTGLRVGVAVANTLGFALHIPVNGKKIEDTIIY